MARVTTNLTMGNLPRLQAPALAALLASPQASPKVTVIDVRDSDYIGGHIRGSRHIPVAALDHMLPELVRTLADQETVVFHCMLSQQRGPSAALRYARERTRMLGEELGACRIELEDCQKTIGEEQTIAEETSCKKPVQMVAVLDRGFEGWQQQFGRDESLTEGYLPDIWEMGD